MSETRSSETLFGEILPGHEAISGTLVPKSYRLHLPFVNPGGPWSATNHNQRILVKALLFQHVN